MKYVAVAHLFDGVGPRVVLRTSVFHAGVQGSFPGLGGSKETKMFPRLPLVKLSSVGNLRDREVLCSASDLQGLNFESCVCRAVTSHSSHHPQKVLLAQFILYVHKKTRFISFHFICSNNLSWEMPIFFNKIFVCRLKPEIPVIPASNDKKKQFNRTYASKHKRFV